MDNFITILKGILSDKTDLSQVYLDTLDINQSLRSKGSDFDDIVQIINGLLVQQNSRPFGLKVLDIFLKQCEHEKLEEKTNIWLLHVMKACNAKEIQRNAVELFGALESLAKFCHHSPELSKKFSSNYLPKIYESLTFVPINNSEAALKCIKLLLELYPGPSGSHRNTIQKFLLQFVDYPDDNLNELVGICFLMLQQVRGGVVHGQNAKTLWMSHQTHLLDLLNSLLNELFSKFMEESCEESNVSSSNPFPNIFEGLADAPMQRMGTLYNRLHNYVIYLNAALGSPYPVPKPILLKKIINMIQKGTSITPNQLQQTGVFDNLALAALLPKIHLDFLGILETSIEILGNHLKPHATAILEVLSDVFKWTSTKNVGPFKKPYSELRIKAYSLISTWYNVSQAGNRIEDIAEQIISEILLDAIPLKAEMTLQVLSGSRKHLSKKARKQLHKAENEKSNISQSYASGSSLKKAYWLSNSNADLCEAALKCLQAILHYNTFFLKPSIVKVIQTKLLQECALFYELPLNRQNLYFSIKCRKEIFNCLFVLLIKRHAFCPPPTDITLEVLHSARFSDPDIEMRTHASNLIERLQLLWHPQKQSLLFPTNMQDVKNTFIMLGSEKLIRSNNFLQDTFVTSSCELQTDQNSTEASQEELTYEEINIDNMSDHDLTNDTAFEVQISREKQNTAEIRERVCETQQSFEGTGSICKPSNNILELNAQKLVTENDEIKGEEEITDTIGPGKMILVKDSDTDSFNKNSIQDDLEEVDSCNNEQLYDPNHKEESNHVKRDVDISLNSNQPSPKKLKIDEDRLMADIESEFVDELA